MVLGAVAVLVILGAVPALAASDGGMDVTHTPRPCLLAGHPARIEARIEAPSDAVRAWVRFRSEGGARFYFVEMSEDGDAWVGVLPSPAEGTSRISYYIDVAVDGSRSRVPASSAYVVDVVDIPCAEGALPVSAAGPRAVGVPRGAPRIPPGFEGVGIEAFLEDTGGEPPVRAPSTVAPVTPLAVQPIAPGSRVRVVTSPGNRRQEGKLVSVDGEDLVVDADGDRVRIPRSELTSLEVREKGSGGLRVLGGLGGAVAGLAVTALICASADACDSIAVAWVGTGVGAALGATLVGGGSWKPVTLATAGPVALDLRVQRAAAGLDLRVDF
jgi:hypothetical protein